jgi:hypothetical protein
LRELSYGCSQLLLLSCMLAVVHARTLPPPPICPQAA